MIISATTLGCPNWSLDRILKDFPAMGYDAVDFRGLDGELEVWKLDAFGPRAGETAAKIAASGLAVSAFSSSAKMYNADDAGLEKVEVFASGGLDESSIAALVAADAPIDGFGVGAGMGVSGDAPTLDIAYKLCEYAGRGRLKLSEGKPVLPGRKQVFRVAEGDRDVRDVIAWRGIPQSTFCPEFDSNTAESGLGGFRFEPLSVGVAQLASNLGFLLVDIFGSLTHRFGPVHLVHLQMRVSPAQGGVP